MKWSPHPKEGQTPATEGSQGPNPAGAGFSATSGEGKLPGVECRLLENSWAPGPLLPPLLAQDATSPEECNRTRSIATYAFAHLLSQNYLNCTLSQLLQAWEAMPTFGRLCAAVLVLLCGTTRAPFCGLGQLGGSTLQYSFERLSV